MSATTPADAGHASPRASGLALAAFGAFAFSGKAIIVKLCYRHGVDAETVLMYRMLLALPFFAVLSWWAGRGKPALTPRDRTVVVLLGFTGYYLSSYLDFLGLQHVSAGLERLILYLNPTIVLLISVIAFRQRPHRQQLVALAVSYAGIVLVFGDELAFNGAHTALGALLVFASAVTYATYLAASGRVVGRIGSMRLTGLASTVACVLCIAQFLLVRPLSALEVPPAVIGLSLLNALACTVVPVLATMMAIERVGAPIASQFGIVGPIATIALGVVILDEVLTGWAIAGSALVMLGVWLLTRRR